MEHAADVEVPRGFSVEVLIAALEAPIRQVELPEGRRAIASAARRLEGEPIEGLRFQEEPWDPFRIESLEVLEAQRRRDPERVAEPACGGLDAQRSADAGPTIRLVARAGVEAALREQAGLDVGADEIEGAAKGRARRERVALGFGVDLVVSGLKIGVLEIIALELMREQQLGAALLDDGDRAVDPGDRERGQVLVAGTGAHVQRLAGCSALQMCRELRQPHAPIADVALEAEESGVTLGVVVDPALDGVRPATGVGRSALVFEVALGRESAVGRGQSPVADAARVPNAAFDRLEGPP